MTELVEQFYRQHHESGSRLNQSFLEQERAVLFQKWIGSGQSVLDLGCRDGRLTRHYASGNQVTGCDIDAQALQQAAELYGIQTRQVDLNGSLPFASGAFDVVVLAEVLEHLPYPMVTLAEIHRVLKPEGRFVGNVPLAYHLVDRWKVLRGKKLSMAGDKTHLQFYQYQELVVLLRAVGFVMDEIHILKGGRWGRMWPALFARNIAFLGRKIH
ncbi:MAG: class I SAM-dependent methyltransferase [Magnetococcales bacterium]|nr:class I SAM-dependent methyltransferase [Magnetococcales bacterium]